MIVDRRALIASIPGLLVGPALALGAPPVPDLASALTAYERESGGRIGLHAERVDTGATVAWRADERFVMCSTFKASLAACVLARVDHGEETLDAMLPYGPADLLGHAPVAKQNLGKGALSVGEMCRAIVVFSDNTCANLLLAHIGGPAALTRFWRATGDSVSRLDHNELQLNYSLPGDFHDTTTPASMAGTMRRFVLGDVLSPRSRARLTDWMIACETGRNRLRAGLPRDWRIGDKTGNNGSDAAGDLAVAWPRPGTPIVICAYTQGGSALGLNSRPEQILDEGARSLVCHSGSRFSGNPEPVSFDTKPVDLTIPNQWTSTSKARDTGPGSSLRSSRVTEVLCPRFFHPGHALEFSRWRQHERSGHGGGQGSAQHQARVVRDGLARPV